MANQIVRAGRRSFDQVRPLSVKYDIFNYASGSTLFEMGNTKVLTSVTLQQGVPHFLRNKKTGWLTAEYSLLPASTPIRTVREVTANKRSGRIIEISRLIGRALRSVVNLDLLPDQTIFIDCDVLQADGGTRTACISGAYLALRAAISTWIDKGIISQSILVDELAAVSVGINKDMVLLDLDFIEDNATEADFNFVLTKSGKIVELQGSAERFPLTWQQYENMKRVALKGVQEMFDFYERNPYEMSKIEGYTSSSYTKNLFYSIFE